MSPVRTIQNQHTRKSSPPAKDSKPPGNEKDEGKDLEKMGDPRVGKAQARTCMYIKINKGTFTMIGVCSGLLGLGAVLRRLDTMHNGQRTIERVTATDCGKRLSKRLNAAPLREFWQSEIHRMAEDSHITTKKNSKLGKIFLSFVDTIEGFYNPSILALIKQVASSSPSPTDVEAAVGLLGA